MGRKLTQDEYIYRAKEVHGDTYIYEKTMYVRSNVRVSITCRIHGDFEQFPMHHLKGHGCFLCGMKTTSTKRISSSGASFIDRSKNVHGDAYDYSIVNYISAKSKVEIICIKHGIFKQTPNAHVSGQGCPKCGTIKNIKHITDTNMDFIRKSIMVHGGRYDYYKSMYRRSNIKVTITCRDHGDFIQTPNRHLLGSGCPKCASLVISKNSKDNPTGWSITNWNYAAKRSKNFDSFKVYIIKCTGNGESFYKIGRTFRKTSYRTKDIPYKCHVIREITFENAKDAFNKESEMKRENRANRYIPKTIFRGMNECFSIVV